MLTIVAVEGMSDFYRRALGQESPVVTRLYTEFTLSGGLRIGLYERESFGRNTGQTPVKIPVEALAPTELYFYCNDLMAAIRRLQEAGARVLSPLTARPWGDEAAYFADPGGNVLVLARAMEAPTPREP